MGENSQVLWDEDSQGLWDEDLRDFQRGYTRICETLGEDLQGFVTLWERIYEDL